jgi:DNA (cytosine-5)-methyltransferase 1
MAESRRLQFAQRARHRQYMEMSEAAEHFGVMPPNGRRDRKSGAKKRKQQDIEDARVRLRVVHG